MHEIVCPLSTNDPRELVMYRRIICLVLFVFFLTGCGEEKKHLLETGDLTPPGRISDLRVQSETLSTIDLVWSAPGDDEHIGKAFSYELRYSTHPDTTLSWWDSLTVSVDPDSLPIPQSAYKRESIRIIGLSEETSYYFALKSVDDAANESEISNVVVGETQRSPTVYFITPNGAGDFPTIQSAVDSVDAGAIIELADGEYTGEGNYNVDLRGKALTIRSQSGDPEECIIRCGNESGHMRRGFRIQTGERYDTRIEGLTITNGHYARGGGIYISNASPTIKNCVIQGNTAWAGGGIYCLKSRAIIEDCLIVDNQAGFNDNAGYGGGIYMRESEIIVKSSVIRNNFSSFVGSGILCTNSSPYFEDCLFSGHSRCVDVEGYETSTEFVRCRFQKNSYVVLCVGRSNNIFRQCLITGNRDGWLSTINVISGSMATFIECTIADNCVGRNYSCILCESEATLVLERCVVWRNYNGEEPANITVDGTRKEAQIIGSLIDPQGISGHDWITFTGHQIHGDPLFCNPIPCWEETEEAGDYHVQPSSPCLPVNNESGLQIGALGIGCYSGMISHNH